MREATEAEYVEAGARAHHDGYETIHMHDKRYSDVITKFCGVYVRAKYQTFSRGKLKRTTYRVNPDFLAPVDGVPRA